MSVFEISLNVPLNSGAAGTRLAWLRELSGREEALAGSPSAALASELVGRVLVDAPGTDGARADVWSLSVSDRDRLVAELYSHCYGDRIEATAPCSECRKSFALGFSLAELLERHTPARPASVEGPDESGNYRLADGCRFRLPTAGDERVAASPWVADPARTLLERCVVEGSLASSKDELELALESLAPVLNFELPANCPHCGAAQEVPFDVASFFMSALARERPLLMREVHCLASAYHWPHSEILALPRSERRTYVALVLAERHPEVEGLES